MRTPQSQIVQVQSHIVHTLYDSTTISNCPGAISNCPLYESTAISDYSDILWEHHNLKLSRHSIRGQQSQIVQTLCGSTAISNCPNTLRQYDSTAISMFANFQVLCLVLTIWRRAFKTQGLSSTLEECANPAHTAVLGNHTLTSGDNLLMSLFPPCSVCVCNFCCYLFCCCFPSTPLHRLDNMVSLFMLTLYLCECLVYVHIFIKT